MTITPPYTLTGSPSLRRARREQRAAALFTALARYLGPADALRANPGRWALYPADLTPQSASSTAQQIKRGLRAIWQPAGTYDAAVRTVDGKPRVYIRYVGEPT